MLRGVIERREFSEAKLSALRKSLDEAEKIANNKACVYLTGSFGRAEGCQHSDLDIFVVGRVEESAGTNKRALSNIDEILLKAELIDAVRAHAFPEFSGDGEYLEHHSIHELVKSLGTPEDDAENTFTARLLLLLESRPLVEERIYHELTDEVVASYWRDFDDHKNDFFPAFLVNDVLRLWRTFCVNYEARTQKVPDDRKIKRRLKNIKLRHSRLLTCYSALVFLMANWNQKRTISPADARSMVSFSPINRIEEVLKMDVEQSAKQSLNSALECYDRFLVWTNQTEPALLSEIAKDDVWRNLNKSAQSFSQSIFESISEIGKRSEFHRLLVV
jgi:hypothetical protein